MPASARLRPSTLSNCLAPPYDWIRSTDALVCVIRIRNLLLPSFEIRDAPSRSSALATAFAAASYNSNSPGLYLLAARRLALRVGRLERPGDNQCSQSGRSRDPLHDRVEIEHVRLLPSGSVGGNSLLDDIAEYSQTTFVAQLHSTPVPPAGFHADKSYQIKGMLEVASTRPSPCATSIWRSSSSTWSAITWFGARFRSGQKNLRDYFLGGRTAPWWAISLSIVSAETSTLTIVGTPALAFNGNLGFLQIVLGYLLARIVISVLFLPHYFRGEMFTAYELMRRRFGERIRKLTASIFLVTRALAEGVRVFAISLVISIVLGTGELDLHRPDRRA